MNDSIEIQFKIIFLHDRLREIRIHWIVYPVSTGDFLKSVYKDIIYYFAALGFHVHKLVKKSL